MDSTFKVIKITDRPVSWVNDWDKVSLINSVREVGGYIAGGWARQFLCTQNYPKLGERVLFADDVDIFCETEEAFDRLKKVVSELGFVHEKESPLSETYSRSISTTPLQIVKPIKPCVGTPEEVMSRFDFTVCRVALLSSTEALVDTRFEEDEKEKRLNLVCPNGSKFYTAVRIAKYMMKGYQASFADLFPVLNALNIPPYLVLKILRIAARRPGFFNDIIKEMYEAFMKENANHEKFWDIDAKSRGPIDIETCPE